MTDTTGAAASPRWIRKLRRGFILALLALAGLCALWVLAASSFAYSKGDRAGILQKFSERGWLCKTWEGELLLAGVPGVVPEKFAFSVRGDEVAAKVLAEVGQRVTLTYEQHKGLPRCLGETEYFVTGVQRLPFASHTVTVSPMLISPRSLHFINSTARKPPLPPFSQQAVMGR